jgi:DNA primase small subunit
MPHSDPASEAAEEKMDIQLEIETEDSPATNGDTQQTADEDIPMADASEPAPAVAVKQEEKKEEVKLEDLFADDDSDDEFPSSRPAKETPQSSSADIPSSPM